MSTIQEALRELKSQRVKKVIKESKKVIKEELEDKEDTKKAVEENAEPAVEEVTEEVATAETKEEDKLDEAVDAALVDEDGDVEDPSFNLSAFANESLNEALSAGDIKNADSRFANISDSVIRKLIKFRKEDVMDDAKPTAETFIEWVDDICEKGPLSPLAIEFGPDLLAVDVWELVDGDEKFANVITKICQKSNIIDADGCYVGDGLADEESEGSRANGKKPTIKDLVIGLVRDNDGYEEQFFDILSDAYFHDKYDKVEGTNESLNEDVQSSLPVHALPETEVINYINEIPVAKGIEKAEDGTVIAKARPVCFFKLGYFKEIEVAAKYRGGRGSTPDDPRVRIFKAIEYNRLYTGADYENLKSVKQFRKETGTERAGEKTGFSYQGEGTTVNKIGTYANGDKALQAYLANNCGRKTKYFISLNDEDLHEASREEVAKYLTPANAQKLLEPAGLPKTKELSTDAESGEEIVTFNPQNVNRLKIANIYMIGNLGQSIM